MDFRLKVFIAVAQHGSFTKAAKELFISQPAISKHIQELEHTYGAQLFNREKGQITLTKAGRVFLTHAEKIIHDYNTLQLEMSMFSGRQSGTLHIGASTTIAQYVLPPLIAQHIQLFPQIKLSILSGNSEQIEQALEEHRIDIGLVEGRSRKQTLRYARFAKDELVLITPSSHACKDEISIDELTTLPLVLREHGSGTLEVIEGTLAAHGVKLSQMNIILQLGSTESIKLLLNHLNNAFAIVSISAITSELKTNKLKVIDIHKMDFHREFAFVLPGGSQNPIAEQFMSFACRLHNRTL